MNNLPQPPEGILDPQMPWSRINPNSRLWVILKARLTGRPQGSENYSSYVNISEADADRLIANMKKDPRGYPSLDQTSGNPVQWMERQRLYQEWLVEVYLENPFREEVDKKIEERQIESRLNEIQEERRNKNTPAPKPKMDPVQDPWQGSESVPSPEEINAEEQDEKETKKEVDKLLDEAEKPSESEKQEDKKQPEQRNPALEKALENIQSTLSSQSSTISKINGENSNSLQTIEIIKGILTAQTEILKSQEEIKKIRENESRLESGADLSGVSESTSTIGENFAEGEILKVDGDLLTVKTLDGNFTEGQKISTGKKGGGLLSMITDIAGMIGKKGGGAKGGSPMKLSSGGIMRSPMPLNKGAFIPPGVYDSPTRGNLLPGQAVIPLNRNVGKNLDPSTEVLSKAQSLSDVLQIPIKLTGAALLSTVGSTVTTLGPLGGFLSPFVRNLIVPLGKIFGIEVSVVKSLLGLAGLSSNQERNKNIGIFSDVWTKVMDKFGVTFGSKDGGKKSKKTKSKPTTTPGKVIQGGDADFWSLAAVASLEGINPQGEADVAQAVYNRVASGKYGVETIKDAVLSPGQFQPVTGDGVDINLWRAVKDRESAIAAVAAHKGKGIETATKYVDEGAANITNPSLQRDAAEWVGGRTDFAVPSAANVYPGALGMRTRHGHLFGWYVGPGSIAYGRTNPGPASIPNFPISAEMGADVSQGRAVDAFTLTGPNDGYQVPGIGEMHGKEAIIEYENGFTILPIENNKFSMSKNPLSTILRWKELLGSKTYDNPSGIRRFAKGGKVTLYSGHADMTADSPGGKGTNGGPDGGAPKIPQASGYFTTEAYLNDQVAKLAAAKSGGRAIYRAPIKTRNGSDPDSNWTRAKNDVKKGNYPVEIHHDAENGKPGMITSSRSVASGNPYFDSITKSFGYYRNGDEGFVSRGGAILEMDALKKSIRNNPSGWISASSTKLANAIKKNGKGGPAFDESSGASSSPGGGEGTQTEEEEKPVDPFEAMEKSIKDISVNMALMKGVESGQIKDVESFKQMKESLYSATDSVVSESKNTTPPPAAAAQQTPNVQVVNQDGKQVIMVGNGNSRTPIGILEDNVCRAFG